MSLFVYEVGEDLLEDVPDLELRSIETDVNGFCSLSDTSSQDVTDDFSYGWGDAFDV